MSHDDPSTTAGMSRRAFAGRTAVAAAVAALPGGALLAGSAGAAPVAGGTATAAALGAARPGLTYLGIDALAFSVDDPTKSRIYQEVFPATGVQPSPAPGRVSAALPLPAGSTIHQLNIAHQGTPILEVWQRSLTTPEPFGPAFQQTTTPGGGGPATSTFDLATPITIDQASTPTLRCFCSSGDSVLGVTVGYLPPAQSFVPFTGPVPRVLDTRTTGGRLAADEERVVPLGFAGARGAVLNLTVTETQGGGGFVAVFPADVAWPGSSSINWFGAGQDLANGVITAVAADGSIKVRGGGGATHVVIDRIGFLV